MTHHAPTTNKRSYLLHCVHISLIKRWGWIALSGVIAAVLASMLGFGTFVTLSVSLAAPLLLALVIALDSRRRHLND